MPIWHFKLYKGIGKIDSGNGIGFCIFSKTETFGTEWQEELCNFQGCFD